MNFTSFILFHPFKHHLRFCHNWIIQNRNNWNKDTELVLKSLGRSQLDMYTGYLSPDAIQNEITTFLEKNINIKENYQYWINENNSYREITLSDNSKWTLRYLDKKQFVHIHPSRYAANTVRIKANVLKRMFLSL